MISDKNTTLMFVLPKDLKQKLEAEAKKQHRSMANLCVMVLEDYLEKQTEKSPS